MIRTCDVGSLPFTDNLNVFSNWVKVPSLMEYLYPAKYADGKQCFYEKIKVSFLDKVKAGIDVPNYPQFRDMNEMFLNSIKGIVKTGKGYEVHGHPSIRQDKSIIPEVQVLKEKSREICKEADKPLEIRVCVTGPYSLSTLFRHRRSELFFFLGNIVSQFVENNIFNNKFGKVVLFTVDEPVFGFLDDPLLDYGSEGREILLRTWQQIFRKVKARNVQSCIHLHNTSNEMFWQVKDLDIIESHVDDPFYTSQRTQVLLEQEDKFLKASIAITLFDTLIRKSFINNEKMNEIALNQQIADTWVAIRKRKLKPINFLEPSETMTKRLKKLINQFEKNRISYAGPECGLRSFPTYNSAIECLRRTALAVKEINH